MSDCYTFHYYDGPEPRESQDADEARPEWLREHSAWIRQNASRPLRADSGFVDLCPIRARFARERLSALQEWHRMEREFRRKQRIVNWATGVTVLFLIVVVEEILRWIAGER